MTKLKVGSIIVMVMGVVIMVGSLAFYAADPKYAGVFGLGGILFIVGCIIWRQRVVPW